MADTIAELFPTALFLHALRDGRRSVHSTLHFANRFREDERGAKIPSGRIAPWAADFAESCKVWARYVEAAINLSDRYPTRCLTVVNEEVVADPQKVLTDVFTFIGVPYEAGPVEHIATTRINTSFPELYSNPGSERRLTDPWKEWDHEQKSTFLNLAGPTMVSSGRISQRELDQLAFDNSIRGTVTKYVPEEATVVVISKGDDELLTSIGRTAWHFPQTSEGWYAGYHPANCVEALEHLKCLQNKGGSHLLIPWASMWWLESYKEFGKYLEQNCQRVGTQKECCIIYSLDTPASGHTNTS
jgi:hypothetical protein